MKKYQRFLSENCQFLEVKFSIYLNRRVFVMFHNVSAFPISVSYCALGGLCVMFVEFLGYTVEL